MQDKDRMGLEALMAAQRAAKPMTDAEWAAQKASFVRGEVGMGSDRDEAAYRAALASGDRATISRLNQEAEDRVKRAFRE